MWKFTKKHLQSLSLWVSGPDLPRLTVKRVDKDSTLLSRRLSGPSTNERKIYRIIISFPGCDLRKISVIKTYARVIVTPKQTRKRRGSQKFPPTVDGLVFELPQYQTSVNKSFEAKRTLNMAHTYTCTKKNFFSDQYTHVYVSSHTRVGFVSPCSHPCRHRKILLFGKVK